MLRQLQRKFLLGYDLWDWRRQTTLLKTETPPAPDKTLLVGSLLTIPATLKAEAVYARALQMHGYKPVFALSEVSRYNVSLLKILLKPDLRIVTLADYAHSGDEAETRGQARTLLAANSNVTAFVALEVDGVRVGRNSLSSVVRSLRASHVDFANADHRTRIERALANSLLASRRAARLVEEIHPEAALFNERGYTPSGELFDVCLVRGVNAVQWAGAPQADHVLYKRYTAATRGQHPLALSDQTWKDLMAAPWSQADEARLMAKLASHYESGAWFNRQQLQENKSVMRPAEVRRHLGLTEGRKIAVIFSHILYDATFFYGDSLYPDYATWLVETVRGAIANPHIHWVVKVHPVNVWRSKMDNAPLEQLEGRLLHQAFGELPPHVTIMPAETDINTFALFQTIDYGLTVRGTVGVELPCYGVPTVTAGSGRYSGRGFTMDPATPADYQMVLANLHTVPRLDSQTISLARRYAFGTFFLRPAPMSSARLLFNHPSVLADFKTHFRIYLDVPLDRARDLQNFASFMGGDRADFLNAD